METRRLGGSDRELSVLGYGAWVTGADPDSRAIDRETFDRAIRTALDAGMTWIDTAELYAGGLSEVLVGRAVRGCRDDVFIVTKVAPAGAGSGLRRSEIRMAIEASLRRLETDWVDLYLLHWYDPGTSLEESWGAMCELVDDGLARLVGVSNFGRELVERCLAVGQVDAVQNQLSLLHRDDRAELAEWLAGHGIGYLAYGSLAFGLLSGGVTDAARFDERDWRSGRPAKYEANYYAELFAHGRIERNLAFARDLARLADELDLPVSVLALRWVLEQGGVTSLVAGSLSPDHIRTNALAGDVALDASALERIDDLLARHLAEGASPT
ncbi:MAG: aldo/keto reductase [Actinomycetota bacterium]